MNGLAGRLVTLAVTSAVVSVLVTGLAMVGLFRQGATEAARLALARDAETVAATVVDRPVRGTGVRRGEPVGTAALRRQLDRRGIRLGLDTGSAEGTTLPRPLTRDDAARVRAGGTLSVRREVGGTAWLVEGRGAGDLAVLLAQPLQEARAGVARSRQRLLLPLLLGLAGGAAAGLLLARQLSGPLSRVAAAARRLSAGDRDVEVAPDGPAEVADVARALNDLAAALAGSEARQRRFLMDVSHELRTPLTAVTGYAEALADGVISGAEVPAAGRTIRTEAGRLERRVEDLLALARTEADDFGIEPAEVDVAVLARAAAEAWRQRAAGAGVDLRLEAPEALPAVTDGERLRQAVDALADNALRVLPAGAPLVLACRTDGAAGFVVEVRDGGPGLDGAALAVAFERGRLTERYRGDRPVGSGLGLALVGELARRLGGRATAAPAAEGGVAFTLRLPLRPPGD